LPEPWPERNWVQSRRGGVRQARRTPALACGATGRCGQGGSRRRRRLCFGRHGRGWCDARRSRPGGALRPPGGRRQRQTRELRARPRRR